MSKNDVKGEFKRVLAGAFLGAVVTLALAALLTVFLALFVASGRAGEGAERPMVLASAFVAAAVGALTARLKNRGAALLSGALTAVGAILVRLLIALLAGGGAAPDGGDLAVILSILCGGIASGAITVRRRRRRR